MASRGELLVRLAVTAAGLGAPQQPAPRLCEAARVIADADGASLTLTEGPEGLGRVVLWSTDATAARLDEIHDSLGDGPAFDALRVGTAVHAALDEDPRRWPVFRDLVGRDTAVRRIAALPMRVDTAPVGVLVLYRARSGPFALEPADLEFLADLVALVLVQASAAGEAFDGASWEERSTIDQATGMAMAQLAISAPDALALLRAHAFALDTTLLDVARQVLDRTLAFRSEEPP